MPRRLATVATALAIALSASPSLVHAQTDPLRGRQWNMDIVEADGARTVTSGSGAVVAIVDTGVFAGHEDLQGRLLPGHDFVQNDAEPQDGNGHGTHVLGIAGANTGNGVGISSIAPGAGYIPVRVLDNDGGGDDEQVAKGIDFARDAGADVINLSLGDVLPLGAVAVPNVTKDAIKRALDAGVVVVAAAGNNGLPLCEQAPDPRLICVGSVDKRRMRSGFSSSGDIMAPGGSGLPVTDEDVLSTYNNGKYEEIAGTSQATPHVAGAAALLVSLGLRGEAVKKRLLETASDAGPPGPDSEYGAGILNARAAVTGVSPGGGGGSGSRSSGISVRKRQRASTLLRKGLIVRCKAPADGRCTVTAEAKRTTVLYGSRSIRAGGKAVVRARATRAGKKLLRRARRLTLRVHVAIPGAATRTAKVSVRR